MSDKIAYSELSRRAIAKLDVAFGTTGQQGNAGNTSHTAPGLADYKPLADYKDQSPENDGASFYGRCQSGGGSRG